MSERTIFRRAHLSNFVAISNALAREVTLSHRERGLLVWLLSYPVDWNVHLESLVTADDSLRSLRRVVQRLEDAGYIKRERERDAVTGRLGRTVFFVYDEPIPLAERSHDSRRKSPKTENGIEAPKTKKRTVGATGNSTGKTPMTTNPSGGNWPPTKTEEKTKTEEEREAPLSGSRFEPPAIRVMANDTALQMNGHLLVQSYAEETKLPAETIWHAGKKVAAGLAKAGITPEDVAGFMREMRTAQTDRYQGYRFVYLAEDLPRWKQNRANKPATGRVLSDSERAAQEAAMEAERVAWRKEQGLS